ncbi:MAG: 50S ribosomal protein L24 [Candidatus Micrarchaeota archaeon]|nr:50S ribosomal protein L24 [Candidatus Micrarchaeota archaeon]
MKFAKNVSKQPRKKRKAFYDAALHERRHFIHAHLSRELRESFGKRNLAAKKGDRVKIMKGKFAGLSGKVVGVDLGKGTIQVEGAVVKKQAGKEVFVPINPSITVILETERKPEKRTEQQPAAKAEEKKSA